MSFQKEMEASKQVIVIEGDRAPVDEAGTCKAKSITSIITNIINYPCNNTDINE